MGLCIVDDGSNSPHVAKLLNRRIAHQGEAFGANGGVSKASNEALRMVNGDCCAPRSRRCSQEQGVRLLNRSSRTTRTCRRTVPGEPSNGRISRCALRPAFSPEYLRAHPYIVHPVGFRTTILRRIGGFDETLRISQDYDLILRAVDVSRRVVHIPEIMYRWRQTEGSSGQQQAAYVMDH
jgi:hypothetical protein